MVLMNLSAGQEWRLKIQKRLVDTAGKKRVGQIEGVALKYIHYHV